MQQLSFSSKRLLTSWFWKIDASFPQKVFRVFQVPRWIEPRLPHLLYTPALCFFSLVFIYTHKHTSIPGIRGGGSLSAKTARDTSRVNFNMLTWLLKSVGCVFRCLGWVEMLALVFRCFAPQCCKGVSDFPSHALSSVVQIIGIVSGNIY